MMSVTTNPFHRCLHLEIKRYSYVEKLNLFVMFCENNQKVPSGSASVSSSQLVKSTGMPAFASVNFVGDFDQSKDHAKVVVFGI